jgi:hypothetical protein
MMVVAISMTAAEAGTYDLDLRKRLAGQTLVGRFFSRAEL